VYQKKRHPFYFCDIFVRYHPIWPILDRNILQGIFETSMYTPTSRFICSYCTL